MTTFEKQPKTHCEDDGAMPLFIGRPDRLGQFKIGWQIKYAECDGKQRKGDMVYILSKALW